MALLIRRLVGRALLISLLIAALVLLSGALSAAPAEQPRIDEYRVKAAFLYNFAKFVDWPATAFSAPTAPLNVCVLGVDPFGAVLEDALRGRQVSGRALVTRRITEVEPGCHLLFISASERKRMPVIADRLKSSSVLTVSEEEADGGGVGMIELFTDGDRVRFNIYPDVVERSGLKASARLIELAANRPHPGVRR